MKKGSSHTVVCNFLVNSAAMANYFAIIDKLISGWLCNPARGA
jgi:hypothetical protein